MSAPHVVATKGGSADGCGANDIVGRQKQPAAGSARFSKGTRVLLSNDV